MICRIPIGHTWIVCVVCGLAACGGSKPEGTSIQDIRSLAPVDLIEAIVERRDPAAEQVFKEKLHTQEDAVLAGMKQYGERVNNKYRDKPPEEMQKELTEGVKYVVNILGSHRPPTVGIVRFILGRPHFHFSFTADHVPVIKAILHDTSESYKARLAAAVELAKLSSDGISDSDVRRVVTEIAGQHFTEKDDEKQKELHRAFVNASMRYHDLLRPVVISALWRMTFLSKPEKDLTDREKDVLQTLGVIRLFMSSKSEMLSFLEHSDPNLRAFAVWSLTSTDTTDSDLVAALQKHLQDGQPEIAERVRRFVDRWNVFIAAFPRSVLVLLDSSKMMEPFFRSARLALQDALSSLPYTFSIADTVGRINSQDGSWIKPPLTVTGNTTQSEKKKMISNYLSNINPDYASSWNHTLWAARTYFLELRKEKKIDHVTIPRVIFICSHIEADSDIHSDFYAWLQEALSFAKKVFILYLGTTPLPSEVTVRMSKEEVKKIPLSDIAEVHTFSVTRGGEETDKPEWQKFATTLTALLNVHTWN